MTDDRSDDRGRKRDTPTGIGPAKPNAARLPRGAGLSGNLPGYGSKQTKQGISPMRARNEPPRAEPSYDAIPSGPWDATTTPPRTPMPEPPIAYPPDRGPAAAGRQPPRPRPADPVARAAADAFAATRPAAVGGGMRAHERTVGRSDPPERSAPGRELHGRGAVPARELPERPPPARHLPERLPPGRELRDFPERTPSYRPAVEPHERVANQRPAQDPGPSLRPGVSPRPPEPKPSLRLQLDVDGYDAANEGRVRVPKRRGPVLLGVLLVLGTIAGGALLWIDAHGGVENFITALQRVASGEPPQALVGPQPSAAAPGATQPHEAPANTAPPTAQAPSAEKPEQPKAADPATPPKEEPQIATGEIEPPDEQAAPPQEPAAAAPSEQQPKAEPEKRATRPAKPRPKPARVVRKRPVKRDPVIRIEQLGEGSAERILAAPPPDPSGQPVLPPPDPPAPE